MVEWYEARIGHLQLPEQGLILRVVAIRQEKRQGNLQLREHWHETGGDLGQ